MASRSSSEVELARGEYNIYLRDGRSFIKRQIPLDQRIRGRDDQLVTKSWYADRFRNEADILQLVAQNPRILVPEFISCGLNENGEWYLAVEYMEGTVRADMAGNQCRMPSTHLPRDATERCIYCADLAQQNVEHYVDNVLRPELAKYTSSSTGFNGVVIPPPWVAYHDAREVWPVRESQDSEFSLWNPEFRADNVLLDTQTLEVRAVVDFEDAGYFPREMQVWKYSRNEQFALYRDMGTVHEHINLLDPQGGCGVCPMKESFRTS